MTTETQVQAQTLPVGYVIEDYRITAVLGQGGFGITYKATDETLRRDVALKEYLPRQFAFRDGTGRVHARSGDDQELFDWGLTRFVDEGRALAMFRHPNIASVIRYIQQNGTAYLVMEFEEGMDLERWLAGRDRPDERKLVHGILVPLLEGLARVHEKGLLHRDIKPENVFIRRDETPVLIDFGASRPHGPEAASRLTSIISAGYSPFEQYGGGERQGPWSDLYALGGTIYRAISGKPPVDAIARHQGTPLEPAVEVGAGRYSEHFLEVIDRTLSLEISSRPQSARELLALLGVQAPAAVDPQATQVNTGSVAAATSVPGRRRAGPPLVALLLAIAAGAGVYHFIGPGLPGVPKRPGEAVAEVTEAQRTTASPAPTDGTEAEPGPASARQETAATEALAEPVPQPRREPAADLLSEGLILADLDLSAVARAYRDEQIAMALVQYTNIKSRFDQCLQSGCAEQPALFAKLRAALETQRWRHPAGANRPVEVEGTVTIQNPQRVDSEQCPYMLDVLEQISTGDVRREQLRTYCTTNGRDREVLKAQDVT